MDFAIKSEGEFHYLEEGEGPIMILLHGLFGALSNWADVINFFSKNNKVVIPLMPIYDLPLLSTNVKELSEFIYRFIAYKKYSTVNLIGNSLGGHVALVYITKYPEKVKTLTLTGSSGLYENAMGGSFPRREDYNFIKGKIELTFYDPKAATKELVDEVYEIINNKGKLIRIISLAKSAIRHNMAGELHTIQAPSCLIWGKNDTITPPEVAEEFHSLLPNSDLYFIDKCGHAPMMEHSGQFNEILSSWLSRHELS